MKIGDWVIKKGNNKHLSLQVNFISLSDFQIEGVLVSQEKNDDPQIEIISGDNLKDVLKEIPANIPVSVNIDGKGIIHKIHNKPVAHEKVITSVLPYASEEEYEYQVFEFNKNQILYSIIKKTQLQQIVKEIQEEGLHLISLSFGPAPLKELFKDNTGELTEISTGRFCIKHQTDDLISIEENKLIAEEVTFKGNTYNPAQQVAYANSLSINVDGYYFSNPSFCEKGKSELKFKFFSRIVFLGSLGLLFVVLLINFLIFSDLSEEVGNLEVVYQSQVSQLDKLESKENEFQKKDKFYRNYGLRKSFEVSRYSDIIASKIPSRIKLDQMVIFPLTGKVKLHKAIETESSKISLLGETSNDQIFNSFLNQLDSEEWIHKVQVKNYINNKDVSLFNIEVEITKAE